MKKGKVKWNNVSDAVLSGAIVHALITVAKNKTPHGFQEFFMGRVIAKVVTEIPDNYWEKFKIPEPCHIPNCDCMEFKAALIGALELVRKHYHLDADSIGKINLN